ncbi:hypothetical protein Xmau_03919 [Xenorhabdus mauleonii]|uniref:Uncharacterized protein n=1 Tax=Xenorhabdus mauleonii TaxID=351675 RepID=A0A1I3VJH0_9GAMM|nr:hypothetical protein [Xenorhabdus mauleonii]PHM37439.1 hypothetical protein Xmau_03919 [Xenorhabdus mauleonii]SFJ95312.1 hypothetical protein SAMN05421680_12122 [Xenorhabdus mauleonii]
MLLSSLSLSALIVSMLLIAGADMEQCKMSIQGAMLLALVLFAVDRNEAAAYGFDYRHRYTRAIFWIGNPLWSESFLFQMGYSHFYNLSAKC